MVFKEDQKQNSKQNQEDEEMVESELLSSSSGTIENKESLFDRLGPGDNHSSERLGR